MRIFINTFGSRGDVQPYVALGKAFKAKGHTVMVCTSTRFESFVVENDLVFAPITNEAFTLLDVDQTLLENSVGLIGMAKTMIKTMKLAKPINRQMILDAWNAAQEFVPELVLSHPKALGAVSIAEKFNAPIVMISLIPMMAPTADFPLIGLPDLKLGSWYNKQTYELVLMGYNAFMKDLDDIRINEMKLPKLQKRTGVIAKGDGTPIPIVHPVSPAVIPQPSDWPEFYSLSGYIYMDHSNEWEPPEALLQFIDKDEPPVYFGFGSMSSSNSKRLSSIIIHALEKVNKRAIIATGWGALDTADLPDTVFPIDHAPHDWLFPRMSAVVHHGGAGTTAAGLRAGKPTVICSFMGDQPFWGKRVYELGTGPKPIAQKKITVEKLTNALKFATCDKLMHNKAENLGKQIRSEDGLSNTVCQIETFAERRQ